jgi:hypothetical protein
MATTDNLNPSETTAEGKQRHGSPKQSAPDAIRERRVDQYEREELEKPEAFQACLGAIQCDLIRVGFALGDKVKQLLRSAQATPDEIREIEPPLNFYLRVTRQIERYRQLEIRQVELQQNADATLIRSYHKDPLLADMSKLSPRTAK